MNANEINYLIQPTTYFQKYRTNFQMILSWSHYKLNVNLTLLKRFKKDFDKVYPKKFRRWRFVINHEMHENVETRFLSKNFEFLSILEIEGFFAAGPFFRDIRRRA